MRSAACWPPASSLLGLRKALIGTIHRIVGLGLVSCTETPWKGEADYMRCMCKAFLLWDFLFGAYLLQVLKLQSERTRHRVGLS